MPKSQRFPMATHILVIMAFMKDQFINSDKMAQSIQTNPAAVRRLLADMHQAGWIESQVGKHGGSRLTVDPVSITLRDVYELVEEQSIHATHSPNLACPVARAIQDVFFKRLQRSEEALKIELAETTLADLLNASESEWQVMQQG